MLSTLIGDGTTGRFQSDEHYLKWTLLPTGQRGASKFISVAGARVTPRPALAGKPLVIRVEPNLQAGDGGRQAV